MSAPLARVCRWIAASSIFRTPSHRKLADKTADQAAGRAISEAAWEQAKLVSGLDR
jgi:hypothetical protein